MEGGKSLISKVERPEKRGEKKFKGKGWRALGRTGSNDRRAVRLLTRRDNASRAGPALTSPEGGGGAGRNKGSTLRLTDWSALWSST